MCDYPLTQLSDPVSPDLSRIPWSDSLYRSNSPSLSYSLICGRNSFPILEMPGFVFIAFPLVTILIVYLFFLYGMDC